jgi:hypothetical protein
MSMTGGISFYDKAKSLYSDGVRAVASSNTADQNLILSPNKYYKWESIGSNDATTETITITLPSPVSISRIFLLNHNFKNFQVQYNNGSPANFTNVRGLDSYAANNINVTNFARDTAYFEFDAVTTAVIIITCSTTQVTNAQKFLQQFICTNELGTLQGYPKMNGISLDRNIRKEEAHSGRFQIQKGYEVAGFDLTLNHYPVQADIDLLDSLHERENNFLVWLCGGKPDQFRIKQRGFNLSDLYQMQIDASMRNSYEKNVYLMGVSQIYSFLEAV